MVNFDDFGKVMIRSPLFPYSLLFHESGQTKDLDELTEQFLDNESFLEGIYWSSVSFYKQVLVYKQGKDFSQIKRKKLFHTLQKYIIRSCSRPTPFGIFAGVNIQNIQESSSPEPVLKRHMRIDTAAIMKLLHSIENNPHLAEHLHFKLNNTLYTVANQFRFLELDKTDGNHIKVSSLEKTRVLKKIVSVFKNKTFSFSALFEQFYEEFDREEFYSYFKELVTMDFFVSEIKTALTNESAFENLERYLNTKEAGKITETAQYNELLHDIEHISLNTETKPLGKLAIGDHILLEQNFENLGIHLKDEPIFHVDLFHRTKATAIPDLHDVKNIKEAIHLLGKVTTETSKVKDNLEKFKVYFTEKYETGQIPLLEVLDVDVGVGFPVHEQIGYGVKEFPSANSHYAVKENHHNLTDWLVNKVEEANCNSRSIEIQSVELEHVAGRSELLSNTFCVVGSKLDNGRILLQTVGGASATSLLSRFAYIDREIRNIGKDIADYEKDVSQNILLADIIWVPNYKTANITRRISPYDYEIPIFYPSSKKEKNQILLEDIIVSVQHNEIILFSKKLRKRIIPVLSNAHNFLSSKNPVYRFLCSLQYQHSTGFSIDYDFTKSKKRFFPQICYRNIILFPAHWILQKSDIKRILQASESSDALKKYLKKWNVPQYVTLSQGDNELFLDIHNEGYKKLLLEEIKKEEPIILKEWLHGINEGCSKYISQFVIPLKKDKPTHIKSRNLKSFKSNERTFFPGREWAYFKIYCSTGFSDIILKALFTRIISPLKKDKKICKWFFIRYPDPHYHIRLRLHLNSDNSNTDITSLLHSKLNRFIKNGLIWKIQIDTYQRELERFGPMDIEESERVFHFDSELFMKLLITRDLENSPKLRLLAATKNVVHWFAFFGFNIIQKKEFCRKMVNHFALENSAQFLHNAREKYKTYKDELYDFLNSDPMKSLFETRTEAMNQLNLNEKHLIDYIHLSTNRWFVSQQREWEYLVYYFCDNYYARLIHINKTNEQ